LSPAEIEAVLQSAHFQLWRDNVAGALDILETANARAPHPRFTSLVEQIQSWLGHLQSRDAYASAYEAYYSTVKRFTGFRRLEQDLRIRLGRKTRKMVRRTAHHPEFVLFEREVLAMRAGRVLDAGCGEGRMALTLGALHPEILVDGIEVSRTNFTIASRLNRFRNVRFHHGLIEDVEMRLEAGSFDLASAFAVLEHVRDVDEIVACMMRMVRPGGRLCFVVPMNEFTTTGPVPPFVPRDGMAGHVRVFDEADLRRRFGGFDRLVLERVPAERWRGETYPASLVPRDFGSFFVAFSRA
jgi:SAM-dependent methyltransferase